MLPRALVARAERAAAARRGPRGRSAGSRSRSAALVAILSVGPVLNLVSEQQVMNTSFDRLALVNTYGAFGTVGRERDEIVFEGTSDEHPGRDGGVAGLRVSRASRAIRSGDPASCRPSSRASTGRSGSRRWRRPGQYPWTLHFVWKLLQGDRGVLRLLANDPFPDAPPRCVRARFYRYRFAPPDDPSGAWWTPRAARRLAAAALGARIRVCARA